MTDTPAEADAKAQASTQTAPASPGSAPIRAIVPYAIPMAGYLVLSTFEGYLPAAADGRPSALWYPLAYTAKVAIVGALMWACRSTWRDLSIWPRLGATCLAVAVGLLVTVVWVGLDGHYPTLGDMGGSRAAFNPNVLPPAARGAFVLVRLLGLVVLVPVFEELFWRSFLLRWLIDENLSQVPMGRVTPLAAAGSSVLFGLVHPEWLPAVLTGLAWAWLLKQTRSLSACIISHATANLALGLYVLATGQWKFW
jgi:CAAX prenyl protease-like protein